MARVKIRLMAQDDIPFLLALWQLPAVNRYADELPWLRGWSQKDTPATAWAVHQARRAAQGDLYAQLIVCLPDGTPIGESFFVALPEGETFGKWAKPAGKLWLLGDIKLLPEYWGRGLGSEAFQLVVAWLFQHTAGELLAVPPHLKNPAAHRVYEKAGFQFFTGMHSYHGHQIMELSRATFTAQTTERNDE